MQSVHPRGFDQISDSISTSFTAAEKYEADFYVMIWGNINTEMKSIVEQSGQPTSHLFSEVRVNRD